MNNQRRLLALGLLICLVAPVSAADIYKRVNEDGVVEFSDKPFPGSNQVTVAPNVVSTNPVQRRERPAAESSSPEAIPPASSAPAREPQTTNYARARSTRAVRTREARRDNRESRDYREERDVAADPDPGRAIRNAVRNAPAPGPR